MKGLLVSVSVAAAAAVGACASNPDSVNRVLVGTAAGAGVGALVGGFEGAVLGAAAGGGIGSVIKDRGDEKRRYYRDTRGRCYFVDGEGRAVYETNVRC